MVLETLINYFTGRKRTLAESDLPIDAEHVQGGSKRFRNADSQPQSNDRIYTTSQPLLHTPSRPSAAPPAHSNAPPPPRSEAVPVQHSKSLSSLDINKRITIAPPTLAPSNFKFTYTASQTLPSSTASASAATPRPERKLKKNPNGPISYNGQWKSSKKMNRHASPAFQVPARKPRAEAKDTYEVPADSKRRRVEEAEPSKQANSQSIPSAQASSTLAASAPTAAPRTTATISPPKSSNVPSLPRLRTPAKPTTPARPSPLRQTWSNQPTHQPTQTATLMAELINKTELPKKPDVSNPYQTANPVANAIPPRRATRRTKKPLDRGAMQKAKAEVEAAAQKAKEKEAADKEKDKVLYVSAQAQIEATLPPGSKRSRPPANFMQQASSSSNQVTPKPYIVEEVTDDSEESSRSAKRSKPSSDILATSKAPAGLVPEPTIVDLDELDTSKGKGKQQAVDTEPVIQKPSSPVPTTPSLFGGNAPSRQPTMTLKSIPKEPSKLRNSFFPETTASSPTSSSGAVSPPPAATAFPTAPAAATAAKPDTPISFLPTQPPQDAPTTSSKSKASAFKVTPPSASSFTFKPTVSSPLSPPVNASKDGKDEIIEVDDEADVKSRVRAMNEKSLPVYDFVLSPCSPLDTSREHVRAREDAKVLPSAALPSFVFEGVKAGAAPSSGFKFDLPGPSGSSSSSGMSSKPLFSAVATPAPVSAAPAPAAGRFNWAAAGMKQPETKDKWVCAVCAVPNKNEVHKCAACESDRPGGAAAGSSSSTTLFGSSAPKPVEAPKAPVAPAVVGFNWAAAGIKAPDMSDKWVCAACDVKNVQSATKCVSCETDKPGASSSSPTPASSSFKPLEASVPKPPTVPAVVGFNWAAAGMKVPDTSDKWVCAECDVKNALSAKKCVSCESDRPGAISSSSSASTSLFGSPKPAPVEAPKPPAPPAVVGFNWAAAGLKPQDTSDKWKCSQCGLLSDQKSSQCETCEADKPSAAASSSSSKPSATTSSTSKSSLFGSPIPTPPEAPKPPAVPAVVGFNWAAAGVKAPDMGSQWTCSLCGLLNEEEASQCDTCDSLR